MTFCKVVENYQSPASSFQLQSRTRIRESSESQMVPKMSTLDCRSRETVKFRRHTSWSFNIFLINYNLPFPHFDTTAIANRFTEMNSGCSTKHSKCVELNIYYPVLLFQFEWLVVIKILKNKINANVSLIIFLYWSVD